MNQVRLATRLDVAAMVAIAAARRGRLEEYQPNIWRRHPSADKAQAAFFEQQLELETKVSPSPRSGGYSRCGDG